MPFCLNIPSNSLVRRARHAMHLSLSSTLGIQPHSFPAPHILLLCWPADPHLRTISVHPSASLSPQFPPTRNRSPSGPIDLLPLPPRSQISISADPRVTVDETVVDRALKSKPGHWYRFFLPNVSQKCAGPKKPYWYRIFSSNVCAKNALFFLYQ